MYIIYIYKLYFYIFNFNFINKIYKIFNIIISLFYLFYITLFYIYIYNYNTLGIFYKLIYIYIKIYFFLLKQLINFIFHFYGLEDLKDYIDKFRISDSSSIFSPFKYSICS